MMQSSDPSPVPSTINADSLNLSSEVQAPGSSIALGICHVDHELQIPRGVFRLSVPSLADKQNSTVHHLPSEILHEIFQVLCCPPPIVHVPKKNQHDLPWTITHTCARWRQIALDIPRLWDHVSFEDPRKYNDGGDNIMEILQAVLSRSNTFSLDLKIYSRERSPFLPCAQKSCLDSHFAGLVKNHGHRIQSLLINFAFYDPLSAWVQSFVGLPQGTFASLTDVNLQNIDYPFNGLMLGEGASKLKAVSISQSDLCLIQPDPYFLPKLHLPWPNLTDLVFKVPISPWIAHTILELCTSLTACELLLGDGDVGELGPEFAPSSIGLPELTELTIDLDLVSDPTEVLTEFFWPLILPSIAILSLDEPKMMDVLTLDTTDFLIECLVNSFSALETLNTTSFELDLGDVFRWIFSLSICQTPHSRLSPEALTLLDEGRVGNLKSLDCTVWKEDMERCIESLEKRWSQMSRLGGPPQVNSDEEQVSALLDYVVLAILDVTEDEVEAYENRLWNILERLELGDVDLTVSQYD